MSPLFSPRAGWPMACLAGALALAACGAPRVAPSDPTAACARQAEQNPDLKSIRNKQLAGYYQNYLYENDYKELFNKLVDQCMAAQGLARPGGVEKVRHD